MPSKTIKEIKIEPLNITVQQPTGIFIDNEFISSVKGEEEDSINPATGEKFTKFYLGDEEDVDKAVKSSRKAYDEVWNKTSPKERDVLLNKLGDLIKANAKSLAAIECMDSGKPFHTNAMSDIEQVEVLTRYFGGSADKFTMGETIPVSDEKFCYTVKEPYGVVGLIVPWNYPLAMASWKMQGALAAGNTIVIKPSDSTPLSLLYTAKLIKEAGFPPGVVNVVPGKGSTVGPAIAKHPDVDKVSFTGSTKVGAKILEYAGQSNLKDVTLECGGKSPAVVFEDADLENAIKAISSGIYYNTGQNCTANSRVYVHESIFDKFLEQFKEYVKRTWTFGDNYDVFDKECTVGPVNSEKQFKKINEFLDMTEKEGIKKEFLLDYSVAKERKGYFIPPTILLDVDQSSDLMQQEIFGPVICISKFGDFDEAIKVANDTDYGLAAMVFTENIHTANKYIRRIKAGTVWVNTSNEPEISVPFGGYKMSGIGRELGKAGVDSFLQTKTVHMPIH